MLGVLDGPIAVVRGHYETQRSGWEYERKIHWGRALHRLC